MKKLVWGLLACAALTTTGTASAFQHGGHGGGYHQDDDDDDWNDGRYNYAAFHQDYRHTMDGIRHGLRDGSYSRAQASRFYRELQNIRRAAYYAEQSGHYQGHYVQSQMERLHARMHRRHDRGHERQDGYSQYDRGYYPNNR